MTVKKLTQLTDEQRELLPIWRDKWIATGLRTEPADRPRAEAAYRACYRYSGLHDDVPIIWVQSPIVGAFAASIAASLLSSNSLAVSSAVGSAVDLAVSSAVGSAVDLAVGSAVGSAVNSAVHPWHYWLGGSLWSAWPAMESFFREVCGLRLDGDLSDRGHAYAEASLAACYWWPNSSFIMACERPHQIKLEDGRLHSTVGHAIEWPDGWGLSAWRGVVVPDGWTNGKPPSPAAALGWQNIEQRRAACEIIGWDRILDELKARMIDRDDDAQIGELIEVDLPDAGKSRFLRVLCATGRRFAIPVPLTIKTALAANAWTFDIPTNLLQQKENRT